MQGDIDNGAIYPSLKERVVFITGGGSGIGESLVTHFSAQGARVTFVDLAEAPSRALVERLGQADGRAPDYIPCDLRRIEDLRTAIAATATKHGPIRVLVNNAGNDDRHLTADVTPDYWTTAWR
jgi:D-xylose 1-dehydrogenase